MDTLKTVTKRTAVFILLTDIYHCYSYISAYYDQDEETEEEKLAAEREIMARYRGNCSHEDVVSEQEHEQRVKQILDLWTRKSPDGNMETYRLNHPQVKMNREAVGFVGGGRATFMQLAHPFIAAGIRDHSYLQRGVSRRFFNTFKYVFGMAFGAPEEIIKASKAVRGLHNKVHGEIGEDVGMFSSKSRFDANQKDAMRYVQWTLTETAVFEYELHVGKLTEEEKDQVARYSAEFLMLFGVPMEQGDEEITYKQFKRKLNAMFRSELTTVGETALDTAEYLLLPPAPVYAPLMNVVKWSTLVSLPPAMGLQYGGRYYNSTLDRMAFAVMHGLIRFQYRLLPPGFRYLSAYWTMYERVHGPRGFVSRFLSAVSAAIVKVLLKFLMPDRDPKIAIARVKEIRSQRSYSVPHEVKLVL